MNVLAVVPEVFFNNSVPLLSQASLSSSVWGSVNTSTSTNWGSDSSSIWGDTHNSNMGFWDEAVKEAVQQPPQTRKGNTQKNNKGNANLRYFFYFILECQNWNKCLSHSLW